MVLQLPRTSSQHSETLYTVHRPGALEGSSEVKKMYRVTNLVHDSLYGG